MIRSAILIMCLLLLAPVLKGQERSFAGPAETRVKYKAVKRIFPCRWRKKDINPEVTAIIPGEIPRIQKVLDTALYKYPPGLLRKNLKRIYVLRTISFFGLDYGGTYNRRKVYISNNGIDLGYTDKFIEGTFHHEFSSVLLERNSTVSWQEEWMKANPDDFKYGNGGVEALRANQTGLHLNPILFKEGFLNEYSRASFEEDWNCYAEYIFLNDPDFWEAWEKHEAIREKTAILIGFYSALDPIFTLEYFQGL